MTHQYQSRRKLVGMVALAAVAAAATASGARAAQGTPVVLSPGTVIPVKLITKLSSKNSHQGDGFSASVDQSKPAYRAVMSGGKVTGVVRRATPKKGKNPGLLDLSFTRLLLPDGRSFVLAGVPASLDSKYLKTRSNGILEAKNTAKNERLKYAAIGAGSAALIKVIGGNSVKVTDVLLGGGLGYGVGAILKAPSQVNNVTLKPGTQLGVLLGNTVKYTKLASK
jgi:hypothetical protein